MVYIGYKFVILTASCTVSTMIMYMIIIGTSLAVFMSIDLTLNILCIYMLTAYYPDDRYYQRLCTLCIGCCAKKYNSYESKASSHGRTGTATSLKDEESTKVAEFTATNTEVTNARSVDTNEAPKVGADIAAPTALEVALTANSDNEVGSPPTPVSAQH